MGDKHHNRIHYESYIENMDMLLKDYFKSDKGFCELMDSMDNAEKVSGYDAYIYDRRILSLVMTIDDKVYKGGPKSIRRSLDEQRAAFWETYAPYMFYKSGKKVFRLTEDLTQMLLDTEIKKIDSFFLRSPYRCIYITLPKTTKFINPTGIPLDGFYVILLDKDEVNPLEMSEGHHHCASSDVLKSLVIVAISDEFLARSDPRNSLYYWNILFKEGDIFEQVQGILDDNDKLPKMLNRKDYSRAFLEKVFCFIINTLLYINTQDKKPIEIKPKDISNLKSKKKIKRAKKYSNLPYYYLGREIVIDKNYKKSLDLTERDGIKREYSGQWTVRGHWRNQPIGKGRLDTKLIWIQPFVKGKEFSEFLNKTYKVK